jgi:hypothetical protein
MTPNLKEYVYTDCDAFSSMDAHAAVSYFRSRGWQVLSHPTMVKRLLIRHEPVVVRKPEAHTIIKSNFGKGYRHASGN